MSGTGAERQDKHGGLTADWVFKYRKDLFWFTVQITQFQKSLITGFLMIEMNSHTHCEYTECIFGMKMLFMVGGWPFSRLGG